MRTVLVGLVLAVSVVGQTARFVPQQYATITAAFAAANPGDTVVVGPGTYMESGLDFAGRRIALVSSDGPDVTTIDGGAALTLRVMSNEGPGTRVVGFTFTNGYPAIQVEAMGGAPALSHLDVYNCVFDTNSADSGGAMKVRAGSVVNVRSCQFVNNSVVGGGGAVSVNNPVSLSPISFGGTPPVAMFDGCLFEGNSASFGSGSAIETIGDTRLTLRNCVVVAGVGTSPLGYSCAINCRGITFLGNLIPLVDVQGCTVMNNAHPGIIVAEGAHMNIVNTIVRGHSLQFRVLTGAPATVAARHCNVEGGMPATSSFLAVSELGTLDVDPMLDATYRQLPGSPMLDAGDPTVYVSGVDAFGGTRQVDGDRDGVMVADVGAHEVQRVVLAATTADPLPNTVFDVATTAPHPNDLLLATLLLVGLGPADVPYPPFGSLLVDPNGMLILGTNAGSATLFNPGIPGLAVVCQSVNVMMNLTTLQTEVVFSNPVDVRL